MTTTDQKIEDLLRESAELALEELTEKRVNRHVGSEIERLMLAALWSRIVWRNYGELVTHASGHAHPDLLRMHARKEIEIDVCNEHKMWFIQQMPVGRFVADFGIAAATSVDRTLVVAIECDGHDFHDRTKEQVARDKARDRFFTESDVRLFRFSGSEIWRDAGACADQVIEFVREWQIRPFTDFVERERGRAEVLQ